MRTVLLVLAFLPAISPTSSSLLAQQWYRGNVHTHTTESDGADSPLLVCQQYAALGYDFLVISDHHRVTPVEQYARASFLTIRGEELTFDYHVNGIGLRRPIASEGLTIRRAVDSIHAQGGIAVLNHPRWGWTYCVAEQILALPALHHIEICNTKTTKAGYPDDGSLWDSVLTAGKVVYGLASDDSHTNAWTGKGWIMVQAGALTRDSILASIAQGRFYASTGMTVDAWELDGKTVTLRAAAADSLRLIGPWGRVLARADSGMVCWMIQDSEYVRGEIFGAHGARAWTQPLWRREPVAAFRRMGSTTGNRIQCYPTVAREVVRIRVGAAALENMEVAIYNVLGQQVALFHKSETYSKEEFTWLPRNVSPGVYFVCVRGVNGLDNVKFEESHKVLVIR